MSRLGRRVVLGVLGLLALALPTVAWADPPSLPSASSGSFVSIGVGDTTMTIVGQTSPGAFVTVADFGQVIGTTAADSTGVFTITFPAQRPDIHKPSVFARDTDGNYTETVTIPTSLYPNFDTAVYFFLPPTISTTVGQVTAPDNFPLSGQTFPGSMINLVLDNSQSQAVTADLDGRWSYLWPTTGLNFGTHRVFAFAVDTQGQESFSTRALAFQLIHGVPGGTSPTPTPTPNPQPHPVTQRPPNQGPVRPITIHADVPPALVPVSESRLPITVSGGVGPYRIGVDWGDGHIEEIVVDGDSTELTHRFDHVGQYNITVYAIDSTGSVRQVPLLLYVQSATSIINNGLQLGLMLLFGIYLLEHSLQLHERREARRHALRHDIA